MLIILDDICRRHIGTGLTKDDAVVKCSVCSLRASLAEAFKAGGAEERQAALEYYGDRD
jgi:hypothetical protein